MGAVSVAQNKLAKSLGSREIGLGVPYAAVPGEGAPLGEHGRAHGVLHRPVRHAGLSPVPGGPTQDGRPIFRGRVM